MQDRILIRMRGTSVRIDADTHRELKRIAHAEHVSVAQAVRLAVRRYDQATMGVQLAGSPDEHEAAWLDADLE